MTNDKIQQMKKIKVNVKQIKYEQRDLNRTKKKNNKSKHVVNFDQSYMIFTNIIITL